MSKDTFSTVLNVLLVAAALAIGVAAVDRQFFSGDRRRAGPSGGDPPTYVEDWRNLLTDGVVVGDTAADVLIVEFADLECSYCRRFHESLTEVADRYGDQVAFVFLHYPLENHRFAVPAAVAAECADVQGRFYDFITAVYQKQDSLGLKSWNSYAVEAGVSDTTALSDCIARHRTFPRIDAGRKLAELHGVRGTPTVLVNGWRYGIAPYESLDEVVREALGARR